MMDRMEIVVDLIDIFEVFDQCMDYEELGAAVRAAVHYAKGQSAEEELKVLCEPDKAGGYIFLNLLEKMIDQRKRTKKE